MRFSASPIIIDYKTCFTTRHKKSVKPAIAVSRSGLWNASSSKQQRTELTPNIYNANN